nr:hypothetical protein T05F1.6a - Caenorhabditis elegans [Caenorhabditis elegans]
MASSSNTMEFEEDDSTVTQTSLPTTTSVLDKSRSLFGNSAVISTPARDSTPDGHIVDSSVITKSSVIIEAEDEPDVAADVTALDKEKAEDEPQCSAGKDAKSGESMNDSEKSESPIEEGEGETFEKKIISMDTSDDKLDIAESISVSNDTEKPEENEEKVVGDEDEEDIDDVQEDDEDEAPKKKTKKAVSTSDDDDLHEDDSPKGGSVSDEKEEPENEDDTEEPENEVEVESPVKEQADSGEPIENVNDDKASEPGVGEISQDSVDDSQKIGLDSKSPDGESEANEENQESQSSSRSTRRAKRVSATVSSTPSSNTPRRGGRGQKSEVNADETKTPIVSNSTPRRGRSSRGGDRDEVIDPTENVVGDSGVEETSPRKGRSRRSVATEDTSVTEEVENTEHPTEEETPKQGRGRRSAASSSATSSAVPTPRSTRGRGRKSQANEENLQEKETEDPTKTHDTNQAKSTRTPREGVLMLMLKLWKVSTRAKPPAKSAPVTPAVTNKRTTVRGRKKQGSITEDPIEEADETIEETLPQKKGRGAAKSAPSSSKKSAEYDPYDLDTEMEHHPEPLKNIHMEVHNFGAVKYAKLGNSESKYSMTEKAAESRIAELQSSPAAKNRRSLADMTPGKDKMKHRVSSVGTSGRRSRAKKEEEHHENDIEMEDAPATATPASSNRGRKRKSEASDIKTPPAKKEPVIPLKNLSDEDQLLVDHPQDDNEPHAPGARVYAVFQKMFYPAVVLSERDGLGRYKVQFTVDNVIKDVPNSGIIPLRALSPGKTAVYNESDVRLDSGPNDISAAEWKKGKLTISIMDEDGEPTDEVKVVDWYDVSFDHSEWRDYVKSKDQSATAIVTSNITTISEATRARKPTTVSNQAKPKGRKKKGVDLVSSRGGSASPAEEEEKLLPMNEEAIGKNIFTGKVFMLTSANRSNSASVPSMFKKKNLMNFITQNGGIVTEQLNSFQERYSNYEPLLISDTYYRTHKYLAALARGVPCVNNTWLQACGEQGKCVDYTDYVLPAGASIFDESQDMPAPKNPSELLKGTTIYVHSTHSAREVTQTGPGGTFIEIWKPILELLGADVVDGDWETLDETGLKFDVVLVDGTFRDEVMEYADTIGASRVTSEWVIQTIILGKAPEPNAHPKFDPYRLHHRTRH